MGERIGRIRRICTDFFLNECLKSEQKIKKIRVNPLNPPNPFSHCIGIFYIFKTKNGIKNNEKLDL
jgi:hypothetical protein